MDSFKTIIEANDFKIVCSELTPPNVIAKIVKILNDEKQNVGVKRKENKKKILLEGSSK